MSENLVLEMLRAVRADVQALHEDNRDLKARVNEVYSAVLSLRRDQALDADTTHRVQVTVDDLKDRIERIERRLDLRDA
jgi:predicted nuclease with TOPRIM domain